MSDKENVIQNEEKARMLKQFEKLRLDNNEAIQSYMEDVGDKAYTKKLNIKNPQYEASIREDLAMFNQIEKGLQELELYIKKRNRCSLSEYAHKFILLHQLFEHSGYADQNEFNHARKVISEEYYSRFSLTHPIEIYDDKDPSRVIVTIPPHQKELNIIKSEDCWAVDHFQKYAVHDRPDVALNVQQNLTQVVVNANRVHVDDRILEHAEMTDEIIKVLQVFSPNHPLLKKVNDIDNKHEPEVSQQQEEKPHEPEVKVNKGVTQTADGNFDIGELSNDDFGF